MKSNYTISSLCVSFFKFSIFYFVLAGVFNYVMANVKRRYFLENEQQRIPIFFRLVGFYFDGVFRHRVLCLQLIGESLKNATKSDLPRLNISRLEPNRLVFFTREYNRYIIQKFVTRKCRQNVSEGGCHNFSAVASAPKILP